MKFLPLLILLFLASCAAQQGTEQADTTPVRIDREGSPILKGVKIPAGADLFISSGQVAAVANDSLPDSDVMRYGGYTLTQSRSTLQKIEGILQEAGLQMQDVVAMTVYLAPDPNNGDRLDFAAWSEAYSEYFNNPETNPNKVARTTIGVASLARQGLLVEVEVIAVYP